jgi:radical SAM family uncharacterized protein/radical SAM-linked protein
MDSDLENILPLVEKPARYLGGETGSYGQPAPGDLRFVLCFPDVYEIGMSHRGLMNLYAALAAAPGVAPGRCFAPWPDMAGELRRRGLPLRDLDGDLPLGEADLLGFSFASPLNFTTALMMLNLAGVPLLARDRRKGDPIVVAGGQAMFNAEPMADFLDVVTPGEGEEIIVELAEATRAAQETGLSRDETLGRLGAVSGAYVPAWYEATYEGGEFVGVRPRPGAPERVRKRVIAATELIPNAPAMVANTPPVHDRLAVEVMRGCLWGCRFCQAGMVTRPTRERDARACLAEAESLLSGTGATELSFLALNACDYSALDGLIENVRAAHPGVRLSLPAARVTSYREEIPESLAARQRGQQTFAPETGTDRLRRVVNKDFTNDDVLAAVGAAGRAGCRNVKLYFMVGLPTETDEDAEAIGELIGQCRRALREGLGRYGNLSAAVSPFVPQAHTPFQWEGLAPPETLRRRIRLARQAAPRQVKIAGEVGTRVLEACLTRGDRRLGAVILDAYRRGAHFDAWQDLYEGDAWAGAFAAASIDMTAYAARELREDAPLPWDHVDAGVSHDFLAAERERAVRGETTPPCGRDLCERCGACSGGVRVAFSASELPAAPAKEGGAPAAPRTRIRFTYAKTGRWRWLSHLELYRLMAAQLRRAAAPLAWSGGYSPKPRLALAPALPVGVGGEAEYGDVFLYEAMDPEDFVAEAGREGPFPLEAGREIPLAAPALETVLSRARYLVGFGPMARALGRRIEEVAAEVGRVLAEEKFIVETRRGTRDIGPELAVRSWDAGSATLEFDLGAAATGALFDLIAHLTGADRPGARTARVTRTRAYLINDDPD